MSATTPNTPAVEKAAYSVAEVAAMLGISRASGYNYVRAGVIESVTLGSRILIPRRVVDELLGGQAAA